MNPAFNSRKNHYFYQSFLISSHWTPSSSILKTFPIYITTTPLSTSHSDYKLSNATNNRHLNLSQIIQLAGDWSSGIVSNTLNATIIHLRCTTTAISTNSSYNNDLVNNSKDTRPHIPLSVVSEVQLSGYTREQVKFLHHPLHDHSIDSKSSSGTRVGRAHVKNSYLLSTMRRLRFSMI